MNEQTKPTVASLDQIVENIRPLVAQVAAAAPMNDLERATEEAKRDIEQAAQAVAVPVYKSGEEALKVSPIKGEDITIGTSVDNSTCTMYGSAMLEKKGIKLIPCYASCPPNTIAQDCNLVSCDDCWCSHYETEANRQVLATLRARYRKLADDYEHSPAQFGWRGYLNTQMAEVVTIAGLFGITEEEIKRKE